MQDNLKQKIKRYWNENPLLSHEINHLKKGSKEVYDQIELIKRSDVERFSLDFWEFDQHPHERVLDIGCGTGFLVRNYARGKSKIIGMDLSQKSARLTYKSLKIYNLPGTILIADAEHLPFKDNSFDFISSSGVLHHTPDTSKTFQELYRVLKNQKEAVISLYYKNILLKKKFFPITQKLMSLLNISPPGRLSMKKIKNSDEFIRTYDGDRNPLGKGYSFKEVQKLVSNFKILKKEIHFFPLRFMPFKRYTPFFLHKILDRFLGTMIYIKLKKQQEGDPSALRASG